MSHVLYHRAARSDTGVAGSPAAGRGADVLSDPHNSLFAFTFGQKAHAVGLLRALLPPSLVQALRWESLAREPVSFVDARLRWLHGDLLFSVRTVDTDEEVLIYLLVEHQSTPDPLMAYRVTCSPSSSPSPTVRLRSTSFYILATHEHIDRQKLRRAVVEAIGARAGENVVTVYEQLIEEGRQKGLRQGIEKGRTQGRAEGRTQGRAEMLLDQLVAKFGPVPAGVRDRILQAGEGELASWATRVLTAATLKDAIGPVTASPAARRAPRPRR